MCVCPLTEANLGDGLPLLEPIPDLMERLSLGSDSNARISLLEEIRWLEYGQRLRNEKRGVLRSGEGEVAPAVLGAATAGGARALGLPAGRIDVGHWADLAVIDLEHPSLAGCEVETLAEALVSGADNGSCEALTSEDLIGSEVLDRCLSRNEDGRTRVYDQLPSIETCRALSTSPIWFAKV